MSTDLPHVVLKGGDKRSKDKVLRVGKLSLEARPPDLDIDGLIIVLRLVRNHLLKRHGLVRNTKISSTQARRSLRRPYN